MNQETEFDCPHPLCDSRARRIKGKQGPLFLCEKCGEEGRNKYIPCVDGKPSRVCICLHAGCAGWTVRLFSKEKKQYFYFCNECKKHGRNPYYDDVEGWPGTDRPLVRPVSRCPRDDCNGMAQQYTKTEGGGKFWICRVCEKAGRNKFYNDRENLPVGE